MGLSRLGFRAVTSVFDGAHEDEIAAELARAWLMDRAWDVTPSGLGLGAEQGYAEEELGSDDEVRTLYLIDWLGELDTMRSV